jgi:hypothetical protein
MRACETPEEIAALDGRYRAARKIARLNTCRSQVEEFEKAVNSSKAVICRSISIVTALVENENYNYVSFYKNVESGGRSPEENIWDATREAADSLIFSHYHKEIIFAALSLNHRGVKGYGDICMVLKNSMIQNRASVFDTHTFNFVKAHGLSAGSTVPPDYRASWGKRARLAVAKLGAIIKFTDTVIDFPERLMGSKGARDGDFIEVHIFGRVNRRAIERVVANTKKMRKPDQFLAALLKKKLKALGIDFEDEK